MSQDPRRETGAEAYERARQGFQQLTGLHLPALQPDAAAPSPAAPPPLYEPGAALQATLAELEVARQQTRGQIAAQVAKKAPVGALLGVALWLSMWLLGHAGASAQRENIAGLGNLLVYAGLGAFMGYTWAVRSLSDAYGKLYKQRVLPKLAEGFGQLTWRPADPPMDEFKRYRVFPKWDYVSANDEIYGTYRAMPLSLLDLHLSVQADKQRRSVFDGIVIALTLPRGLHGATVVAPREWLGGFAEHLFDGLQPVHLENPAFAKAFQVHASDQVSARALLTPAFMERFLHLADAWGAPQVLVQEQRLIIALPVGGGSLFQPPTYRDPAAARETLTRLHQSIADYLRAADAVIDLDQGARQQAA